MKKYSYIARGAAGISLILAWGLTDSPLLGVVLVLVFVALSAIRYRFKPYKWCTVTEIAISVGSAFLWFPALLGLWLAIIALLENKWNEREAELLQREHKNRVELLELEQSRGNSELQVRKIAHLTELSERARIAQDIHDHVGHEVSGTLIALRAAVMLYERDDKRAGELLNQAIERLESASVNLRETVHNLKPAQISGTETLRELCQAFTFCEVIFSANGDLSDAYNSDILVANLKEALTNISRHSNATKVDVSLDSNADYVRLTVHDNGDSVDNYKIGMGLNGMRERVHIVGGTLTINTDNGFKIVGVIPK